MTCSSLRKQLQFVAVVIVTIAATLGSAGTASGQIPHNPMGALDSVSYDALSNTVTARGWAGDQDGSSAAQRVHLYVDGKGWVALGTGGFRPDVLRRHPALDGATGFSVRKVAPAGRGNHQVCAYAINQAGGSTVMIGCRTVFFAGTMVGHIDKASNFFDEKLEVQGWALDPYAVSSATKPLRVLAAGKGLGSIMISAGDYYYDTAPTDVDRPDVDRHYPNNGSHHGFDWSELTRDLFTEEMPTTACLYRLTGTTRTGRITFLETTICSPVTYIAPGN